MIMLLCGITIVAAPAILVAVVGLSLLLGRPLGEQRISRLTQLMVSAAMLAALGLSATMLLTDQVRFTLELGHWVYLPSEEFHFTFKLLFDRLSLPFVILSLALCGIIGAFASRYLHREAGYPRFFLLYQIFLLGIVLSSVAGTIETLFLGWELVGLPSALLVAFFQNRRNPAANGLRVWTIYRVADGAFLLAALVLHHLTGGGDLDLMMGATPWPDSVCPIQPYHALFVGSLLLVAAAGKSALVPFSGWLPRAMEGPTPSSAIFYGALSVHLGAFLLLRVGPLLEQSVLLQILIVAIGSITAVYAAITCKVQSDVKSGLAFASLLQVSIIVVEIGLGFRYIALMHIIGHASMRTLQLLRAPSLLRDFRGMENDLGHTITHLADAKQTPSPATFRLWCYRFALERGSLDTLLDERVAQPVIRVFRWLDAWERRWVLLLTGRKSPLETDVVEETETP